MNTTSRFQGRERHVARIPRDSLALGLLLLVFAGLIFIPKNNSPYPNGYAGLYTLMAEEIVNHNFAFPVTLPFYGPGGMPFAYPPLAFYIMATATHFLGIGPFDYLRFAPALFYLLSLVPMFFLSRNIGGSRRAGIVATVLMATSVGMIDYQPIRGRVDRAISPPARFVSQGFTRLYSQAILRLPDGRAAGGKGRSRFIDCPGPPAARWD